VVTLAVLLETRALSTLAPQLMRHLGLLLLLLLLLLRRRQRSLPPTRAHAHARRRGGDAFELGVEGGGVAREDSVDGVASFLAVMGGVATDETAAVGGAEEGGGEALAVEFEAFGFFAGASHGVSVVVSVVVVVVVVVGVVGGVAGGVVGVFFVVDSVRFFG